MTRKIEEFKSAQLSDAEAALEWRIIEPGILGLPTTSLTIQFVPESMIPYWVFWKGKDVSGGEFGSLREAKAFAVQFIADLLEMGLEP